jgi:translation initiation factor 2-alpha kinase 4
LKPGNVFLDAGNNIRLGDFGLATTRKSSRLDDTLEDTSLRLDDISHLIGDPLHSTTSNKSNIADDTITGGVGTRFYCAPEQEGRNLNVTKGRPSYDTKADIFSLGIVLFEMFHPPFSTMMHRAETLEQLRGKCN